MTKECNSTNGYAFDYDAFIFSLINPYGKPFKSRVTNPKKANRTNQEIAFGESDIWVDEYSHFSFSPNSFTKLVLHMNIQRNL